MFKLLHLPTALRWVGYVNKSTHMSDLFITYGGYITAMRDNNHFMFCEQNYYRDSIEVKEHEFEIIEVEE